MQNFTEQKLQNNKGFPIKILGITVSDDSINSWLVNLRKQKTLLVIRIMKKSYFFQTTWVGYQKQDSKDIFQKDESALENILSSSIFDDFSKFKILLISAENPQLEWKKDVFMK